MHVEGQNAEIVERAYAAFNSGDMETLTELFHEDACWHTPGRSSIAGDTHGREESFAKFGRYVGDTGGTFKATLQGVFESEDGRVVGVHHNSAEREGKLLDTGCCIEFKVKDGQIVHGREHFFDLYNWDEFWS
jgi:ketosteroid isomerase-like protein